MYVAGTVLPFDNGLGAAAYLEDHKIPFFKADLFREFKIRSKTKPAPSPTPVFLTSV